MYRLAVFLGLGVCTCCGAGKYNPTLSIDDKAPAWQDLPGVDGENHSLSDLKQPVVVVVFTCNSCPYAIDYEDRINALHERYKGKDVAVIAINVNKYREDLPDKMKERAKEKGFTFPYLFDESQKIARDYGATYTPEFFVLNKERKVVYMGALDDNTDQSKVNQKYVQEAIDATLADTDIEVGETVAIGCRIRFERTRRTRRQRRASD